MFKVFSIVFLLIFSLNACSAQVLNKLKIKHAEVSPTPNYVKSGQTRNPLVLIDGQLAVHRILWLDNNTLGWQNQGQITIDLELQETSVISKIIVHTAKNEAADAYLPLNINIFTSVNGKDYNYSGDISGYNESPVNTYKAVDLQKDNINANAKYIRLVVNPQGRLFFTDEITVMGQKSSSASKETNVLTDKQFQEIITKNKLAEINRRALIEKLSSIEAGITTINQLKAKILNEKNFDDQKIYQQYQSQIYALSLSKKTDIGLNITFLSSPWGKSKSEGKSKPILVPTNLTEYIAIQVVNNQDHEFSGSYLLQGANDLIATVYEAQEIKTRTSKNIEDVLNPITANSQLEFYPGETKVFILALKAGNEMKSTISFSLTGIKNDGLTIDYQSVNLGIDKNFQNSLAFNVNVWPYYTYPFFKGREQQVKEDLVSHYVNVFVIPPWVLQLNNITTDHITLKNYLKNYHEGDKVLLYLNHRGYVNSPGNFMQPSWQQKYLIWYDAVLKILEENNINDQNIYLYPFDEVKEKEIPLYKSFVTWIKRERPQSQIYTTVYYPALLPQVTPLADTYQVLISRADLKTVSPTRGKDLWIYDIMDDSKDQDPYSRYRLLAWKAFQYKAQGIGFWAYAEQFGDSVWDDFDGTRGDYNVVYDKGNSIIPSRRWEAFKQGIEDYFILSKYQQKFGQAAAQKLVSQILSASDNQEMAEEVRMLMVRQLSE